MDKLKQKLKKMKENAFCFVHLMADYVNQAIKGRNVLIPLERHLRVCPKCAREKQDYEKFLEESPGARDLGDAGDNAEGLPAAAAFKQELEQLKHHRYQKEKPGILPGQIWSTPGFPDYLHYRYGIKEKELPYSLEPRPFLVYGYDSDTGAAQGFPVNMDYFEFASDFDLIVPGEESGLGFELMVEVWNPLSTAKEFLQDYWGAVPAEVMAKVGALAREFNGAEQPGEVPANIVTGRPLRFETDLRFQFRELEQQITGYISAPLREKQELEAFMNRCSALKLLETMMVAGVVYIHRHKDFLRTAAKDGDNMIYLYAKEQPIFNRRFTLKISIHEMEGVYRFQLAIIANETREETRGFVIDVIEWEGEFPGSPEELKTAYLLLKENGVHIKHIRLWEQEKRLSIPGGKNVILGIYKAGKPEQIEFIPIDLSTG